MSCAGQGERRVEILRAQKGLWGLGEKLKFLKQKSTSECLPEEILWGEIRRRVGRNEGACGYEHTGWAQKGSVGIDYQNKRRKIVQKFTNRKSLKNKNLDSTWV